MTKTRPDAGAGGPLESGATPAVAAVCAGRDKCALSEPLMLVCVGDVAGQVRGKGIPVTQRERCFAEGIGWTPTNVQITCFDTIAESPYGSLGDLVLRPAPETEVEVEFSYTTRMGTEGGAEVEGWREHFVLADITYTDGRVWECCLRSMLKAALADLRAETGLSIRAAFEHEFMFVATGKAGLAFSLAGFRRRKAFGERLLGSLARARLRPHSFLREFGADQYEVTVEATEGVGAADQAVILRELTHAAALAEGEAITFTPLRVASGVGNGVHVHLSLYDQDGAARTYDATCPNGLSQAAGAFVAGILKYLPQYRSLVAGSAISHLRLVPNRWSAAFNNLGYRDREAAVRICAGFSDEPKEVARQFNIEFRATDASANPHLVLATLVRAGLQGLRERLPAPAATSSLMGVSREALAANGLASIGAPLDEAIATLEANPIVRSWFPDGFVDIYCAHKRGELAALTGLSDEEVAAAYSSAY